MIMYAALPVVQATQQWSIPLPNMCNISFSFYYFIVLTIVLYIPGEVRCGGGVANYNLRPLGSPTMIGHMMKQRAKFITGKVKTN